MGIEMLEDANIELCANYIESGECILFLGPQFAIDDDKGKLHELLKTKLQDTNFKEKIDFTYDNLFIFKNPKPSTGDKMRLNISLKKVYMASSPHDVYQKIPQIPFSAIISCSPDHFLKEEFEKQEMEVFFHYYSRKGAHHEMENGSGNSKVSSDITFLYNLFGYVSDEDSLITTYESFYQFIISIMGEEQQLPLELRNRIVDAKIFIFMGFDLTRWYIPLLVHKLNSFKQDQRDSYATALINTDNTLDDDTQKYLPIEMIVMNGDSIPTIDALHERLRLNNSLRNKNTGVSLEDVKVVIKGLIGDNMLPEAMEKLKAAYKKGGMDVNDVIATEARFEELKQQTRLNTISEAEAKLERSKIINALLDMVDLLK